MKEEHKRKPSRKEYANGAGSTGSISIKNNSCSNHYVICLMLFFKDKSLMWMLIILIILYILILQEISERFIF